MKAFRRFALAAFAVLTVSSSSAASAGLGHCGDSTKLQGLDANRAWIRAKQPLYYFDSNSRLVRSNFAGTSRTSFPDHGFYDTPSAYESHRGKLVAYFGVLRDLKREQLWLLDLAAGKERLLLEEPSWRIDIPEFSPDGRWLAVSTHFDSRSVRQDGIGIYLFDLRTGTRVFLGWPAGTRFKPRSGTYTSLAWSRDGKLLAHLIGPGRGGARVREFWRLDPETHDFAEITGRYDEVGGELEFRTRGSIIALADEPAIASIRRYTGMASPDRALVARIDDAYRLRVGTATAPRLVARGSYNDCEGPTIGINGWVDGHGYLVFVLDSKYYIHAPDSGKTAVLFPGLTRGNPFFWADSGDSLAPK